MKTTFFAVALLIMSAFTVNANDYSFVKEYPVSTPANLKITTSGGGISVHGYDKDVIEVKFIIKKRNEVLAITFDQLSQYADVDITTDKQNLTIVVRMTKEPNMSVSFEVKTPRSTKSNLNTAGGGINVEDLIGNQSCNTSGGGLMFKQINGNIDCKTAGGGIVISDVKGKVNADTSGGGINLTNVDGNANVENSSADKSANDINVKTSGGSLHLSNVSGSIEATTMGGGIVAKISTLKQSLKLITYGGSIDAEIPNGSYDLNVSANRIEANLSNFEGTNKRDKISGKLNGGGIPVDISTEGGHVHLAFK